ncbi:MAG: translation initiation factor eIF-1A [Methanoculleaceae archaeon]
MIIWNGADTYRTGVERLANKASRRRKANSKSKSRTGVEGIVRVRLPNRNKNEMFGRAESMLGANHVRVRCFDGVTRTGRIKGKIKKRVWIREGDLLIIVPWSVQDDKCDIFYRYVRPQVEWLDRHGYL